MDIKKFLEYLNDETVKEKILEIASLNENQRLADSKDKEEELLGRIEDWKRKYCKLKDCLNSKKKELKDKNNTLKKQLSTQDTQISELYEQNTNIQNQLDFYKQSFEAEIKIYEKFNFLSEETKHSLSGIFKNNTLNGFLSCGVQEKNIQNLWDYIKNEILEDKNQDIETLKEIFYFFFEKYTISYDMYTLLDTKEKDSFDTELHIKHNTSTSSNGAISKIYFKGYKNTKTQKIIKQSIVKIG